MANGWSGADPTATADADDYELSSVVEALAAVTITALRIWSPATALTRSNRKGHIWDVDGTLLDTVTMPDAMPTGWSEHTLASPRTRSPGQFFIPAYETNGNYGTIANAFTAATVFSADLAVCFPRGAAVNGVTGAGNGRFHLSAGSFPNTSFNNSFYGVDIVYTVGGATAPTVTGITLTASGLTVTATISATDPEGLAGATYVLDWGDGSSTSSASAGPHQHTYASGGIKAILAKVTDSSGLSGYRAGAIELIGASAGIGISGILNTLRSHAARTGLFRAGVYTHELKSAPEPGLVCEIWVAGIQPARRASGLSATSARVTFNVRVRTNMLSDPQDGIDPAVVGAADELFDAYHGDFQLGGVAAYIDVLGVHGEPMQARGGYIEQDKKMFRLLDITVPIIINDVWNQSP